MSLSSQVGKLCTASLPPLPGSLVWRDNWEQATYLTFLLGSTQIISNGMIGRLNAQRTHAPTDRPLRLAIAQVGMAARMAAAEKYMVHDSSDSIAAGS